MTSDRFVEALDHLVESAERYAAEDKAKGHSPESVASIGFGYMKARARSLADEARRERPVACACAFCAKVA